VKEDLQLVSIEKEQSLTSFKFTLVGLGFMFRHFVLAFEFLLGLQCVQHA
jgi:hypothetical protein